MASDPHHQFRRRLDQVTDERDAALAALERCRRNGQKLYNRIYTIRLSRDLWRHRALKR